MKVNEESGVTSEDAVALLAASLSDGRYARQGRACCVEAQESGKVTARAQRRASEASRGRLKKID